MTNQISLEEEKRGCGEVVWRFYYKSVYIQFLLPIADMRRDVQEIFKMTPHEKQVMMFSATLSKEIRPVCRKFMQDVSLCSNPKFQSFCIALFRRLFVHCFVVLPLVALPTRGCQCHECPYQRGKVILLGTSHSARTLVCRGFAAAQENTICHSSLNVFITSARWKLKLGPFL